MIGLLIAVIAVALALAGAPLFVVLGGIAMSLFALSGINISAVIIEAMRIATSPVLITIPLFTFAGYIMAESGTPKRLINLASALFGWLRGGTAIITIIACTFFTAFTGATGVTIIALGGLLFPLLMKEKYGEKFSYGLITSAGTMGMLFPPSIAIILYGLIANVSINKLFIAGIIPGAILVVLIAVYSVKKSPVVDVKRNVSGRQMLKAVREMAWELPLPFIVLGGIYSGTFTAAEAAVITALYAFIVEVFIYRDLNLKRDVPRITRASIVLTGGIFVILGSALGLTNYLVDEQVPMKALDWMQSHVGNKYIFLILLNIFLILVGCIMDVFSATMVVVPLILPIAVSFGIDPVHLGMIFLTNLGIGYLTPPVGMNLFIAGFRFRKPVIVLAKAALPFLFIMLAGLMLITYVPGLSLWLVDLFKIN